MSMAISHFAIGVSFSVILLYVTGYQNHSLRIIPIFIFGVLSFIPDIHHIFTGAELSALLIDFHTSVYANIFFMHQTMDTIDPRDSKMFATVCLLTMFLFLSILWASDVKREYL